HRGSDGRGDTGGWCGRTGHPVQLEPLGSERSEILLVVIPGSHHLVDHLDSHADQSTDEVMLPPVLLELAGQGIGRSSDGEGQEAVAPAMPGRRQTTAHSLRAERVKGGRQQGFVLGAHGSLLVMCGVVSQFAARAAGTPERARGALAQLPQVRSDVNRASERRRERPACSERLSRCDVLANSRGGVPSARPCRGRNRPLGSSIVIEFRPRFASAESRPTHLSGEGRVSGRTAALRAVGISGSPSSASKSRALVAYALERLADRGAETALIDLATLPAEALLGRRTEARVTAALEAVAGARVVIAGTPIYRATYSGLL